MKVSIIIPVFNVSEYIERCIKSVMNQTYSDIECIIVDDATPDDSIEKCERLIAEYSGPIKFSMQHHQENRGLSAARNTGTAAATGEYIYYLDSDDEITPDSIARLLKVMLEDSTIDLVQGNHIEKNKGRENIYYKNAAPLVISCYHDLYEQYFKYHHICAAVWNKLIRKSFIDTNQLYFKEGLLYEDRQWLFYAQKYLNRMHISEEITYHYHIRPNSITTSGKQLIIGNSFNLLYKDILTHLTPGREKLELCGYVYGFCKPYCEYIENIPSLKETYNLYLNTAKQYNCWFVLFLLLTTGTARQIGNPIRIMKWVHALRWKIAELPDNFSTWNSK